MDPMSPFRACCAVGLMIWSIDWPYYQSRIDWGSYLGSCHPLSPWYQLNSGSRPRPDLLEVQLASWAIPLDT